MFRFCVVAMLLFGPSLFAGSLPEATRSSDNPFLPPNSIDRGWRFIRGPTFDGHSPEINLADSWPREGPPVLWTCELGKGYSALVADAGRVYTQYQTLRGQFVVCLDGDTGKRVWEYFYGWPFEAAGVYPGPRATPTLAEGKVYFAAPDGLIGCLHATNGALIWSRNVTQEFQGDGTDFGYSCSPTVVAGLVILPVGGPGASIVALRADTGKTVWKSGDDPASYTPIYPIRLNGRDLLVGYLQNALVICELKSGQPFARLSLSKGYDEHSAWPIYSEPHLWISGPFQAGAQLLELREEQPRITTVWSKQNMSNDILSSVLVDGALYGFDVTDAQAKVHRPTRGHFRCINFKTGEEYWSNAATSFRHDTTVPNADFEVSKSAAPVNATPRIGHASVIAADGKLYLLNDTGELIVARANTRKYEELGRVSLLSGEIVWTPPTLHRGRLYVRNHSRAVCVFVGRLDLLSANNRKAAIRADDIPQHVYRDWAAIVLGVEPEYAFDLPTMTWLHQWFFASAGILLLPALIVGGFALVSTRRSTQHFAAISGGLAFVLGAIGTTWLSNWRGDFVFTWPVCLFVALQLAMSEVKLRREPPSPASTSRAWRQRLRSLLVVATFMLVCAAYFFVCRRLSLVFEWAFLVGFPGAVPFLLLNRWLSTRAHGLLRLVTDLFCRFIAFAAFYWSSVLLLWSKY